LSNHGVLNEKLRCELLKQNLGFAKANNHGVRVCRGDYVLFLNADTIVTPGWLGRLLAHSLRNPSIGLVCPVTNFAGNETKINVAYTDEPSMERFAVGLASEMRGIHTDLRMAPLFCALMSRNLFTELGGLDERYGVGMFEDDDLSAAIRQRGSRVAMAEDTFVHHFGQGAFSSLAPEEYKRLFERNRKLFEDKWNSPWQSHRLRPGAFPPDEDVRFQPEQF
jgi:GT2 family glycosyltransferase